MRDERGSAAIEFGVVGAFFFAILLGAMEFASYWYHVEALRTYAAETMRAALVVVARDGSPGVNTCNGAVTVTNAETPGLGGISSRNVTCVRNLNGAGATISRTVTVTVSYTHSFAMVSLLGIQQQTITETQTTTF